MDRESGAAEGRIWDPGEKGVAEGFAGGDDIISREGVGEGLVHREALDYL